MPDGLPFSSFLLRKILFLCTLKLDRIYLDIAINSRQRILDNLAEVFYMLALRFNAIVCSVYFQVLSFSTSWTGRPQLDQRFFFFRPPNVCPPTA